MKNLFKILLLIFSNCLFAQGLFTNGFWQNGGVGYTPVSCVGAYGGCSLTCGGGTQTYTVSTPAANGGAVCPVANGTSQSCNTQACCTWQYQNVAGSYNPPVGTLQNTSWMCCTTNQSACITVSGGGGSTLGSYQACTGATCTFQQYFYNATSCPAAYPFNASTQGWAPGFQWAGAQTTYANTLVCL
jgi:hypothetical protein